VGMECPSGVVGLATKKLRSWSTSKAVEQIGVQIKSHLYPVPCHGFSFRIAIEHSWFFQSPQLIIAIYSETARLANTIDADRLPVMYKETPETVLELLRVLCMLLTTASIETVFHGERSRVCRVQQRTGSGHKFTQISKALLSYCASLPN